MTELICAPTSFSKAKMMIVKSAWTNIMADKTQRADKKEVFSSSLRHISSSSPPRIYPALLEKSDSFAYRGLFFRRSPPLLCVRGRRSEPTRDVFCLPFNFLLKTTQDGRVRCDECAQSSVKSCSPCLC